MKEWKGSEDTDHTRACCFLKTGQQQKVTLKKGLCLFKNGEGLENTVWTEKKLVDRKMLEDIKAEVK